MDVTMTDLGTEIQETTDTIAMVTQDAMGITETGIGIEKEDETEIIGVSKQLMNIHGNLVTVLDALKVLVPIHSLIHWQHFTNLRRF